MGCGCGRSTPNRGQRLRTTRLKQVRAKSKKQKLVAAKRIKICNPCPFSDQTRREKKKKVKICHKCNRLIINISKDPKFKCPIGRF